MTYEEAIKNINALNMDKYCGMCGQAIDWGESE